MCRSGFNFERYNRRSTDAQHVPRNVYEWYAKRRNKNRPVLSLLLLLFAPTDKIEIESNTINWTAVVYSVFAFLLAGEARDDFCVRMYLYDL